MSVNAQHKPGSPVTHPAVKHKPLPPLPRQDVLPTTNSPLLLDLLKGRGFAQVMQNPAKYRLQIVFTQINRDAQNRPHLVHHTFRLDSNAYYFPASTVKLPTAAMALEKLRGLKIKGLDADCRLHLRPDPATCAPPPMADTYFGQIPPTLRNILKLALMQSDNASYDLLYDFVGQERLNEGLYQKGYHSASIVQRYAAFCSDADNRIFPPIDFYSTKSGHDSLVYSQPELRYDKIYTNQANGRQIGRAEMFYNGQVNNAPADFSTRNFISLQDLHLILISLMMPSAMPAARRFHLSPDDYQLLRRYLSMYASESVSPRFNPRDNWDARLKYLYYGGQSAPPDTGLRIFNKVGLAYGFLTDCAYFVDFSHKVEFFLTATLYVDENDVVGDYDGSTNYWTIGLPFLKALGRACYTYELARPKKYPPRLGIYRFNYLQEVPKAAGGGKR